MTARPATFLACPALWLMLAASTCQGSVYTDWLQTDTDPAIYWTQNETGGSVAFDAAVVTGGVNDGTYVNATPGGIGPRPTDGYANMASDNLAATVGSTAGSTLYTSLATTAGVPTGSYSVSLWFNSTADPLTTRTLQYLFMRGNGTADSDRRDAVYIGGNWYGAPSGKLTYISGQSGVKVSGDTLLQPNTWYQLLFVRDDAATSKARVYLNGQLEMEDASSWYGGTGERLTAATRTDTHTGLGLFGAYDDVAVWDRALTASEARDLYFTAIGLPDVPYAASVLRKAPEAYWRLNETTGNDTAADATIHGHDVAYYTPVYSSTPTRTGSDPDVGPRPSAQGGFEADNNAPTLPGDQHAPGNDDGFAIVPSGVLGAQNDYSIEMWFRRGALSTNGAYLMHRNDLGYTNGGDYLGVRQSGQVFIYNGSAPSLVGPTATAEDQWYHVAMVREGTTVRLYVNGLLDTSGTLATYSPHWTNGTWTIGGRNDTGRNLGQEFNGNIDEVAIYGRVLGGDEFQENYVTAMVRRDVHYAQAVLNDSPEAYWRLDEVQPYTLAADATGNGHTFTYHAAAQRTGTGVSTGPRPGAGYHQGFTDENNSPYQTGATYNGNGQLPTNGFVGIAEGVLPGVPGGFNNDYTIEMLFRAADGDDQGPYGAYLMHRTDVTTAVDNVGDFLGIKMFSGGQSALFTYNGDWQHQEFSSQGETGANVLDDDTWYHVAMVREGDNVTVYLDGEQYIASHFLGIRAATTWANGQWAFGGRSDMPAQQVFAGNIDEIAIYGRALSAEEIYAHYYAANVPEPATWILLGLGVLGLALGRTRRRSRRW